MLRVWGGAFPAQLLPALLPELWLKMMHRPPTLRLLELSVKLPVREISCPSLASRYA